jgi:hypothetical protein
VIDVCHVARVCIRVRSNELVEGFARDHGVIVVEHASFCSQEKYRRADAIHSGSRRFV